MEKSEARVRFLRTCVVTPVGIRIADIGPRCEEDAWIQAFAVSKEVEGRRKNAVGRVGRNGVPAGKYKRSGEPFGRFTRVSRKISRKEGADPPDESGEDVVEAFSRRR